MLAVLSQNKYFKERFHLHHLIRFPVREVGRPPCDKELTDTPGQGACQSQDHYTFFDNHIYITLTMASFTQVIKKGKNYFQF